MDARPVSFRNRDVIASSDVGGAWGAAYAVGTPISALITGICCALAIEYFQNFPQDSTRIRGSVIIVVATTIVGLLLAIELTYVRLVNNAIPPGGFGDIPWQDDAVALICGVCQLICSAYFAYSAHSVARRKKFLLIWYGLLMTVIFLSTFFRAILGLMPTEWLDGAALCPKMTFLWLICSLLLDLSIAVTLLSHLQSVTPTPLSHTFPSQSAPPNSMSNLPPAVQQPRAPILGRLLTTILTSFSLTAILMFSLLILVLAMHGTEFDARLPKATGIFTALRLLATPTYAVTFLYTLNRRNRWAAVYHSSIFHDQMVPLAALPIQNSNFNPQSSRAINEHMLKLQMAGNHTQINWANCFTSLGATKIRSAQTRSHPGNLGQETKFEYQAAYQAYSSASAGPKLKNFNPSVPNPPPPTHQNEEQAEVKCQNELAPENYKALKVNHLPETGRPESRSSSVILQVYHGNTA